MKKIALLFTVAILIFSGCEKSYDLPDENMPQHELKSKDTRTENSYFYPVAPDAYFPLECDGELVDWLEPYDGSIKAHLKEHYKNGYIKWIQVTIKGSAKSKFTGEIYTINELNKISIDLDDNVTSFKVKTHARGESGKNIILFTEITDFYNFEFEITKAICVGI